MASQVGKHQREYRTPCALEMQDESCLLQAHAAVYT